MRTATLTVRVKLTLRWNTYLLFYWCCELCVEKRKSFVNFSSLVVLKSSVDEGWWGGTESLIWGQLKSRRFRAKILAEAISMTHSDMLYRLDISTFNLYEPLLFQNFVSFWEYYKGKSCKSLETTNWGVLWKRCS